MIRCLSSQDCATCASTTLLLWLSLQLSIDTLHMQRQPVLYTLYAAAVQVQRVWSTYSMVWWDQNKGKACVSVFGCACWGVSRLSRWIVSPWDLWWSVYGIIINNVMLPWLLCRSSTCAAGFCSICCSTLPLFHTYLTMLLRVPIQASSPASCYVV